VGNLHKTLDRLQPKQTPMSILMNVLLMTIFVRQVVVMLVSVTLRMNGLEMTMVMVCGKFIQYMLLPFVYLAWVYPILMSYLTNGPLVLDSFKSHLSFETTVILIPAGHLCVPP
jgi:hypothetical protein